MEYIKVMEDCNALQEGFQGFVDVGLGRTDYSVEDLATIALEMNNRGYNIKYNIQFGKDGLEIRVIKT